MSGLPEPKRHFREATDLAIRLQEEPGNRALIAEIRGWIGQSAAHREAWTRVAVIHGMAGKALKLRPEGGVSRRQLLSLAGLGLAGAAGAGLMGPGLWRRWRADHLTGTARLETILLPDGSQAVLGPDSALALAFTDSERRIELLQGMAYFEMRPDSVRRFTIAHGAMEASGFAAGFEMSEEAGLLTLAVSAGGIEAGTKAGGERGREALAPGEWLTFGREGRPLARGRRGAEEVASWRGGLLIAEAEPVRALIERIARWQPGTVLLADRRLGARRVSGVFDLRDPLAALAMAVEPFGGRVRRLGPGLVVVSSI